MRELEHGMLVSQLVEEPPDAEVIDAQSGVVEQHDAAAGQLRQPRVEVVPDGVVAVTAVDVEQVDRAVAEAAEGLVEGHAKELREAAVERVVVRAQVGEHLRAVPPGVVVAGPGVDGVAPRLHP